MGFLLLPVWAVSAMQSRSSSVNSSLKPLVILTKSTFGWNPRITKLAEEGKIHKGYWVQTSEAKKADPSDSESGDSDDRAKGEWGKITELVFDDTQGRRGMIKKVAQRIVVRWEGGRHYFTTCRIKAYSQYKPRAVRSRDSIPGPAPVWTDAEEQQLTQLLSKRRQYREF